MKPTFLLPVLAVLLASPVMAQTTDPVAPASKVILTSVQTEHILKELEKVEVQIGKGKGTVYSAALAKFREGMASPAAAMSLYLDCFKLVHYERRDLKQVDFKEWATKYEVRLKDDDLKTGLCLQLEFLALAIQAQDADTPKKRAPLVAAVQAFLAKEIMAVQGTTEHSASGAVSDKATNKGQDWKRGDDAPKGMRERLRQSVKESEFAKAYSLEDFMKSEDWEYQPLSVRGIYSNIILPYYLTEKPTEVAAQWDARINAEMALQKALMSETQFNEYNKNVGPRLLWEKGNYLVENNVSPVNALADMLKLIQTYPSHPDAAKWLKDFRVLVKKVSESSNEPVETPIGSK